MNGQSLTRLSIFGVKMKLLNIVIPTYFFSETVEFYREIFNLETIFESEQACFFKLDSIQLAIHDVSDNSVSPTGRGIYLDLVVDELDFILEMTPEDNGKVVKTWTEENQRFAIIEDPSGNRIELIQEVN